MLMHKLALILVLVMVPTVASAAEQPQQKKKASPPVAGNPCAQYGAGFVQVQGTSTCIRATGSIQVDVGVQSGSTGR